MFEEYTNQLLEFAKSQPPFECKGNCKAPSGSYIGAPWIQNNLVQERAGAAVSLHCQVWTKFNSEAAQGNYELRSTNNICNYLACRLSRNLLKGYVYLSAIMHPIFLLVSKM